MDATLPFDPFAWEDDQPVLWLVIAALFIAVGLLVPAVVDAARRGCLAVWTHFAVNGVTRMQEDGPPAEPPARFGWEGASSSTTDEDSIDREGLG